MTPILALVALASVMGLARSYRRAVTHERFRVAMGGRLAPQPHRPG